MPRFRWNAWNLEHIARHGVDPNEAETVVRSGARRRIEEDKYKAVGRGRGERWIQVIYVFDPPGIVYIIHARPLTDAEKRRERRRQK